MSFDKTWSESLPDDQAWGYNLDNYIRDNHYAVRERLAVEHYFYADEGVHTDVGEHKPIAQRVHSPADATALAALTNADCAVDNLGITDDTDQLYRCTAADAGSSTWEKIGSTLKLRAAGPSLLASWVDTDKYSWTDCDVSALVEEGIAQAVLLQVYVSNPSVAGQVYLATRKNGTAHGATAGVPAIAGYSENHTVGGLLIVEIDANGVFEYIAYGAANDHVTTGSIYYLGQIY